MVCPLLHWFVKKIALSNLLSYKEYQKFSKRVILLEVCFGTFVKHLLSTLKYKLIKKLCWEVLHQSSIRGPFWKSPNRIYYRLPRKEKSYLNFWHNRQMPTFTRSHEKQQYLVLHLLITPSLSRNNCSVDCRLLLKFYHRFSDSLFLSTFKNCCFPHKIVCKDNRNISQSFEYFQWNFNLLKDNDQN